MSGSSRMNIARFSTTLVPLLALATAVGTDVASGSTSSSVNTGDAHSGEAVTTRDPFNSFLMAISMIGLSEIGDKTFLIAALMAMRHSKLFVFSAAATSLAIMTILSGIVGHSFVNFIPERYVAFLAGVLFLVFGYKLTMEGLEMSKDAGVEEELAEVEEEIAGKDMNNKLDDIESGNANGKRAQKQTTLNKLYDLASLIFSPAWVQIFVMIFLGELGDRSQISIIALASDNNYWFTIAGAVIGHFVCSAVAVIGGQYLASMISMRTITLAGAFFFYIFALIYLYTAFA